MSERYTDRAAALRNHPTIHYNCAQAVAMAFAPECGISEETARRMTAHFGSGMKMASVCGAITGALMVIGLLGGGDSEYNAFLSAMREGHHQLVNCADLLRENAKTATPKKTHCDGMVLEATALTARIMGLENT